jgi:hypothetical protein
MTSNPRPPIPTKDWPLPDEMLIELGRLSSLWVTLENFLNLCIGKLAGYDPTKDTTTHIFILHSTFPQRLDIFSTLCDQLSSSHPNLSEYKKLIRDIKEAQSLRNRYVHNPIGYNQELKRYELGQASARGKFKASVEVVTIEQVKQATEKIFNAGIGLYELVLKRAPRQAT